MSKLEATAYNYGAKIKGGAIKRGYGQFTKRLDAVEAENDRLRAALEKIAEANWLDDPHEARRIARAALAGQSPADKWEEEIQ